MPCSGIQTDGSWVAYRSDLPPTPEALIGHLGDICKDVRPSSAVIALNDLLTLHPAFSQLLAHSPELRSVIVDGTQKLLPNALDASGGVAHAHVLWTICTCVWQGVSVVVDRFGKKMPGCKASQTELFRALAQANNDLRDQLATCRRDYLRELTELRERCRLIEPCAGEALEKLLKEEPVMFFEPFDFVMEEATKEFISETVAEKLRLLMLRGWGKLQTDEVQAQRERIQELEAELAAVRNSSVSEEPRLFSMVSSCKLNGLGASEDEELASTRCSTAMTSQGCIELQNPVCSKCWELQCKMEKLVSRLQESVSRHVVKNALAYAGLPEDMLDHGKRKQNKLAGQTAFDRLYADAKRRDTHGRISKIRQDVQEVHALQSKEIGSCMQVARGGPAKQKIERVKSMHSKAIASATALHDAIEGFYKQIENESTAEDKHHFDSACASLVCSPRGFGVAYVESSEFGEACADSANEQNSLVETDLIYDKEVRQRMQRIKDGAQRVNELHSAELAHCASLAHEGHIKTTWEGVKVVHDQFATSSRVLQEALVTLRGDVAMLSLTDAGSDSANAITGELVTEDTQNVVPVQSRSGRLSRGYGGGAADQTIELEPTVPIIGSPERRRLSHARQSFQSRAQAVLPPVEHSATIVEPHMMGEASASIWKDHFAEQDKTLHRSALSLTSLSPEKKVSHSTSPHKSAFHRSSEERKLRLLTPSTLDANCVLLGSALPHSSSPDRRKKRSMAAIAHLDPLRKTLSPLSSDLLPAASGESLHSSRHAFDQGKHVMTKNASLPALQRPGSVPSAVG